MIRLTRKQLRRLVEARGRNSHLAQAKRKLDDAETLLAQVYDHLVSAKDASEPGTAKPYKLMRNFWVRFIELHNALSDVSPDAARKTGAAYNVGQRVKLLPFEDVPADTGKIMDYDPDSGTYIVWSDNMNDRTEVPADQIRPLKVSKRR